MKKKYWRALAPAILLLHGPLAATAATVSNKAGTVLVSKASGFAPVTADTELAPGGRVLVQPGGIATITYADNCIVRVGSGFWLVQASAPCPEGTTLMDFTERMNQQTPPPPSGGDIDPLVVGGLAVGGGVLLSCVVWWCRSDSNRPASP